MHYLLRRPQGLLTELICIGHPPTNWRFIIFLRVNMQVTWKILHDVTPLERKANAENHSS